MKIYRILLATIIIAGLMTSKSYAQRNWAQDADFAFKYFQYYEAVGLYKKAYTHIRRNKTERARILFQIAECYRYTNDPKQAETWYKKAITAKYPDAIASLYYADMLKAQEKYDEAVEAYNSYKDLEPKDPRGQKGVESSTLAQQWIDNPTRYEIDNLRQVNSTEMDYSPVYGDKKFKSLVFVSSREGSTGTEYDAWTGQSFSDIYSTTLDKKGAWQTPVSVGENINTQFAEGPACFNEKFNEMYFTRCGVEKKKQIGCQIYVTKKKGTSWDVPVLVPLAADSISVGHPCLSADELTLYFSADSLLKGYGGKDIWMAKRTKKTKPFDKPINLGPNINTSGDEMFPYLRDENTLYFASNGWPGMGGLDIFKSEKNGNNWGKPVNLKYPMNSGADDFGIIFEGKAEKGYFSSNRKGGKGSDDIYSFYEAPLIFTLAGKICNDSTKEMLKGATLTLYGSDGTIVTAQTDATGEYQFDKTKFLMNTSYELKVEASGFFGARGKESTVGLERSKDFIRDFCLVPIPKKPIVLPEILYPFAQWILLPEYQDSLNGLIQIMKDNPRIVVELGSHTDTRGSNEYNDSLSYKRAKSVVNYLISKGIDGERLVPYGYGSRVPRILTKDMYVSKFTKGDKVVNLDKPYIFPKGVTLTDDYINQYKAEENKFESAHQLNRRTEFRILRDDYIPRIDTTSKNVPNIIEVKSDSSSIKKDDQKQQPTNDNKIPPDNKKTDVNQQQPNNVQNNNTGTIKQDSTTTPKPKVVKKKPGSKNN